MHFIFSICQIIDDTFFSVGSWLNFQRIAFQNGNLVVNAHTQTQIEYNSVLSDSVASSIHHI